MASSLFDRASIYFVPSGYKAGSLYPIKPLGTANLDVTRATTAFRTNASGVLESVASGVPRLDYPAAGGCPSLLVEPNRTNLALHSRDLANAAWVKTDVTAAKDALGADAVASGATTLTASAASGTVLQTVTAASAQRTFSAYVRRVTGTGTIEMTMDNGTTWTAITLTSAYQAIRIPSVTNSNPVIGFRILTSGDAIAVDFTQLEAGFVRTSPIPTTTATVTRNADLISKTGVSGFIGQTEGTMYLDFIFRNTVFGTAGHCGIASSNASNRVRFWNNVSINTMGVTIQVNAANIFNISVGTLTEGTRYKLAFGYKSGDSAIFLNGVQVGTTNTSTFTFAASLVDVFLGRYEADTGGTVTNTGINAFALYTTRLSNTELAAMTSL
jgi:hypothetical protein